VKSVSARVTGTATRTTSASRHPRKIQMSTVTEPVARRRWRMSSFTFSRAVSP
jgi:hypothetical protein